MTGPGRNPFELPAEPRTGLDLVWWSLFEVRRLERYGRGLSRQQLLGSYLRAVPWVCLLAVGLWLAGNLLTVWLELPLRFPDAFKPAWVAAFQTDASSSARLYFVFVLGSGWAGLAAGLAADLAGLAVGLAVGLAGVGLALGLAGGLAGGLAMGLAMGLAGGLAMGLAGGLLGRGLVGGLGAGTGFVAGWVIGYYRLPFWLFQTAADLRRLDLCHNTYLWDDAVRLPIWGARRRLTEEAVRDPETGAAFAAFLLEHRPLQRRLAAEVLHAVTAGRWALAPLEPQVLTPPPLVEEEPGFRPSDAWLAALEDLGAQLIAARQETQISFRRAAYLAFTKRLDAFRDQTLRESQAWARHYLPPLDLWRAEADKALRGIEDQTRSLEPIAANLYRPGAPLRPGEDAGLFLGREDVRRELRREVQTAAELPLLLIQGQRRVGKTSLLNFLPELLGPGFRVVFQDCQGGAVTSVPTWLADLRRRVAEAFGEKPDGWDPRGDWAGSWASLEPWFTGHAERSGRRLILALDEYETLHRYLQQDPDQGRRLLGAMRSFSQHQTRVCLLFAGATPFSELRGPDWSEFFVQAVRLKVDYLGRADAIRLITEPVPSLRYPPQVPERLFELTQGHPALLQRLCKELVDIANRDDRRAMTEDDLNEALARGIDRETPAMERFWNEFCVTPGCRACVEDILGGRAPADRPALMRLAEHGYIVQRDGRWRLRVPLFEVWLNRYREGFA